MTAIHRLLAAVLRPTLARRLFGSLVLSFVIVLGVLLGVDFVQYKQAMAAHSGVQQIADVLASTLDELPETDAIAVARATLRQWNALREGAGVLPGKLELQLRRADGSVAYSSPVLAGTAVPAPTPGRPEVEISGRRYWIARATTDHWRLAMAEPSVGDAWMLAWLLQALSGRVLLAFPLVLVPLWVTMRRGIRPLVEFARQLEARDVNDLSPLAARVRHDELQPIVAAFNTLLERLLNHLRRERAFVQDAAHELRTPMAALAAQAYVLARAQDDRTREDAGRAMDHAVARTSHLSRQLLALAALDGPRGDARRIVDVAELTRNLVALAAPSAIERDIELAMESPERLPWVLDASAYESALSNLLDNAVRYGRPGGHVLVTLREEGQAACLEVADDGPGIPPPLRERAFERFWRGAGHDVPGSGLGLSIVKEAVARLHGTVRIDDGLNGCGLAFCIRLAGTN